MLNACEQYLVLILQKLNNHSGVVTVILQGDHPHDVGHVLQF